MTTEADAPSDELTRVSGSDDLFWTAHRLEPARPASVVSGRFPSSRSSVTSRIETSPVSLFFTAIVAVTGIISSANLPFRCASAVRCCDGAHIRRSARG